MHVSIFKKGYSLVALVVFLTSCSDSDFTYGEFESIDSLEIIMPDEFLQVTNWSTYRDRDRTILVEYGINDKADLIIHQVDFVTNEYRKPLVIKREGPTGYNSTEASVFFKSRDSFYVFPAARQHFYLFGSNGSIVKQYYYNSDNYSRYYRSGFYSSAVINDENLIIPVVNDVRYDDLDYFSKTVPLKFYDLSQNLFSQQLDYPSYIYGKNVPSSFTGPSISRFDSTSLLINYKFSDSLYIFNTELDQINSFYCGSDYFGKPKILQQIPDQGEDLNYKVREVKYEKAIRKGDKIYRIVSHISDQKHREAPIFEILEKGYRVVSLVELDLNTQELSYYKLPIAKYFVFDDKYLYAGGVSIREEGNLTYRKFYRYTLN